MTLKSSIKHLALLLISLPHLAYSTLAYDIKSNTISEVIEIEGHSYKLKGASAKAETLWRHREDLALETNAQVFGVKKGDRVMFLLQSTIGQQPPSYEWHSSPILVLFENGLAQVRSLKPGSWEDIRTLHYVDVSDRSAVFRQVDEIERDLRDTKNKKLFKLNQKVCLSEDVRHFRKGQCGRIVGLYENQRAEVLTFSLFGLRQWLGEYDLTVRLDKVD